MQFKLIGNAAGIFTGSKGTKILCDPWIKNGAFEGSWFHYPSLKTKIEDLQNVDGIYVSHIHSDHYDARNFDFPKDTPIIILNEDPNFLKKNLIKKGYNNLIEVKHEETKKFREFNLTIYKSFVGIIYYESLIRRIHEIDSALILNDNNITAINFNDNTPDETACRALKNKFKTIDLAMLKYNAAGPYPSCFENLSVDEKKKEKNRIIKRNFDHLCKIIPILEPKTVLPFAGGYIIGGKNYFKNEYLATTTWDECADYLNKNLTTKTNVISLRENHTFDISNQTKLEKYERIDLNEMKKYIQAKKDHKYTYELDEEPDINKLEQDIELAKEKLLEKSKKYDVDIRSNVFIELNGKNIKILDGKEKNRELFCSMDSRLLRRILDRKTNWNGAEIGAHITFKRSPNKTDPDVHAVMIFFHL